jgi:hypothetical protein
MLKWRIGGQTLAERQIWEPFPAKVIAKAKP